MEAETEGLVMPLLTAKGVYKRVPCFVELWNEVERLRAEYPDRVETYTCEYLKTLRSRVLLGLDAKGIRAIEIDCRANVRTIKRKHLAWDKKRARTLKKLRMLQ